MSRTVKVAMQLPELPAGYEYTGEYRKPAPDEHFLNIVAKNIPTVEKAEWMYLAEYPIIKKVEQWRAATLDDARRALQGEEVVARSTGQRHKLVGGWIGYLGYNGGFLMQREDGVTFRVTTCEVLV